MDEKKLNNFKAWLREEELSQNTIDSYVFAVTDFFEKYQEINKENLIQWKQALMDAGKSPKTVNLRLCAIERWCQFAGIDIGKVKRIRFQKQTTVENAMDIDNYRKLMDSLEEDGDKKWIAIYMLLALTGARISEALRLRKADLEAGVTEMQTKNKVRRIYIPAKLLECEYWNDLRTDDYLITNRYGQKMTSRGVSTMMKNHAIKYNIPTKKMHPHAFRHMFAIEFLKRNSDISLLADIMGHSGVNTTMIYTRRSGEEQKKVFNETIDW